MTRLHYSADDPREWLNRARSALAHAQQSLSQVDFEGLCCSVQQAAEIAIKEVFVKRKQAFPFTHNPDRLLSLLRQAWRLPSRSLLELRVSSSDSPERCHV